MFDNVCKFLAESYSADFATWLLGEPIPLTQLSPSELSLEPIRADALILLQSEELVVQLEFQTDPDPTMPFRMADYRLRVYRRFPGKRMRQIVIYLRPTASELVYQTNFSLENTQHQYEVIRLWEQPTQPFLEATGLLPLAVLTQTPDQAQTLREVATRVEALEDQRLQSNIAASAGILAGLLLEKDLIQQVLRREMMQQSVIYQEWRNEFLQEGEQRGLEQGLERGRQEFATFILRQLALRLRLANLPEPLRIQVEQLSLPQLEALGEALLDFQHLADLETWLRNR